MKDTKSSETRMRAEERYYKALVIADEAYEAAIGPAQQAYYQSELFAKAKLEEELDEAAISARSYDGLLVWSTGGEDESFDWELYDRACNRAWQNYYRAIQPSLTAYEEAKRVAASAREEAVELAREAYYEAINRD